jgi:hypothetical protein
MTPAPSTAARLNHSKIADYFSTNNQAPFSGLNSPRSPLLRKGSQNRWSAQTCHSKREWSSCTPILQCSRCNFVLEPTTAAARAAQRTGHVPRDHLQCRSRLLRWWHSSSGSTRISCSSKNLITPGSRFLIHHVFSKQGLLTVPIAIGPFLESDHLPLLIELGAKDAYSRRG